MHFGPWLFFHFFPFHFEICMCFSGMRRGRWGWRNTIKSICLWCIYPEVIRKHCWERAFGWLRRYCYKFHIDLSIFSAMLPHARFWEDQVHLGTLLSYLFLVTFIPKALFPSLHTQHEKINDWIFTSLWSLNNHSWLLLPWPHISSRDHFFYHLQSWWFLVGALSES